MEVFKQVTAKIAELLEIDCNNSWAYLKQATPNNASTVVIDYNNLNRVIRFEGAFGGYIRFDNSGVSIDESGRKGCTKKHMLSMKFYIVKWLQSDCDVDLLSKTINLLMNHDFGYDVKIELDNESALFLPETIYWEETQQFMPNMPNLRAIKLAIIVVIDNISICNPLETLKCK